eukprot:CAMPEP_0171071996 /NCGR_PEP_ID=MMETSP0766_2-20121228/10611_1 /TAXON_ID=439317 /ORGANISM="Gambierdiscus australes, Strain CAWD 149" /LENGTH=646 /DNA_ID=CAMNT_0011528555 /DNA_START=21 /DNA_END=1961 /DNA_ORIENTATION=+
MVPDVRLDSLRDAVVELQEQTKALGELSKYIVKAHFAFREHHASLYEEHHTLCECLHKSGLLHAGEFHMQLQANRQARAFGKLLDESPIAQAIICAVGAPMVSLLCTTSRLCMETLAGNLFEASIQKMLVQDQSQWPQFSLARETQVSSLSSLASVTSRGCLPKDPAPEPDDCATTCTKPRAPTSAAAARKGACPSCCLAVFELLCHDFFLADTFVRAMGCLAAVHFRVVSRASCTRMREIPARCAPDSSPLVIQCTRLSHSSSQTSAVAPKLARPARNQSCRAGRLPWDVLALGQRQLRQQKCDVEITASEAEFCTQPNEHRLLSQPALLANARKLEAGVSCVERSRGPLNYPCANPWTLRRGQAVELHSLQKRPETNGMSGSLLHFMPASNRWQVLLSNGEWVRASPTNIKPLCLAGSDATGSEVPERRVKQDTGVAGEALELRAAKSSLEPVQSLPLPMGLILSALRLAGPVAAHVCRAASKSVLQSVRRSQAALYITGGCDGTSALNSVEYLDPISLSWHHIPLMARPRDGASDVALGVHLYVCGGSDGVRALRSAERLSPSTGAWQALPLMSVERSFVTATILAKCIQMQQRAAEEAGGKAKGLAATGLASQLWLGTSTGASVSGAGFYDTIDLAELLSWL